MALRQLMGLPQCVQYQWLAISYSRIYPVLDRVPLRLGNASMRSDPPTATEPGLGGGRGVPAGDPTIGDAVILSGVFFV
jgi:hypothetical protein